jgi:phage gpG-like protein
MAVYKSFSSFFSAKKRELERAKKNMPKIIANDAKNFFTANFKRQGFLDASLEKWQQRKKIAANERAKEAAGEYRAILTGSGGGAKLRRSIDIISFNSSRIVLGSDRPYAKIHNEGGVINHPGGTPYIRTKDGRMIFIKKEKMHLAMGITGAHKIPMPKRQFIGNSKTLNKNITNKIYRILKKALN